MITQNNPFATLWRTFIDGFAPVELLGARVSSAVATDSASEHASFVTTDIATASVRHTLSCYCARYSLGGQVTVVLTRLEAHDWARSFDVSNSKPEFSPLLRPLRFTNLTGDIAPTIELAARFTESETRQLLSAVHSGFVQAQWSLLSEETRVINSGVETRAVAHASEGIVRCADFLPIPKFPGKTVFTVLLESNGAVERFVGVELYRECVGQGVAVGHRVAINYLGKKALSQSNGRQHSMHCYSVLNLSHPVEAPNGQR